MSWVVQGNRLVKYSGKAHTKFWEDYWSKTEIQNDIIEAKNDKVMQRIFCKYLPRNGKILEAGCGIGKWVMVLGEIGYKIEGIDFSSKVINKVKKFNPDIPVKVADILDLPYADGTFSGYISLGVLEHLQNGPHQALLEARRILSKNGVVLISVPYFSPIRKFKAILNLYKHEYEGEFFQYAFSKTELLQTIRNAGFEIVDIITIRGLRGMFEEISLLKRFSKKVFKYQTKVSNNFKSISLITKVKRKCSNYLKHFLKVTSELKFVREIVGHMIIVIAKCSSIKKDIIILKCT
ncbi:hypothetical protein AMJ52_05760 [candidate division TA06 bacterium DG_78]|uniref:Methyltransferase type 11 domain-containing protein n=1 Tax=candidate division TA06 bacterium DG_78 TaxID=1703772 RepID=A0A0S7YCY0_UNCT6|nr:MAG: hypothetical protein AMJ52_05760 [candidate division TA06 bacterium DG_78]